MKAKYKLKGKTDRSHLPRRPATPGGLVEQAPPISWDMSEATLACGFITVALNSAMAATPCMLSAIPDLLASDDQRQAVLSSFGLLAAMCKCRFCTCHRAAF